MTTKDNKTVYRAFRVTEAEWYEVVECFKARTGLIRVGTSQILRQLMDDYVANCRTENQSQASIPDAYKRGEYG